MRESGLKASGGQANALLLVVASDSAVDASNVSYVYICPLFFKYYVTTQTILSAHLRIILESTDFGDRNGDSSGANNYEGVRCTLSLTKTPLYESNVYSTVFSKPVYTW